MRSADRPCDRCEDRREIAHLAEALTTARAERDVWSGEACKQEQADGSGPCGACRYCLPSLVKSLTEQRDALLAACEDLLSGWRYVRETHGDLYGVGWDRAEDAARAAIEKARSK